MSLESRRAADSGAIPMDDVLHVRAPHELRLEVGRLARLNGFDNVGEYTRWLYRREVDLHIANTLRDDAGQFVIRTPRTEGSK